VIGDIRELTAVQGVVARAAPDFVFHLAAQPLVRLSYEQPVETYATNVMGTVHLLESLRVVRKPCAVVVVTTDKCYENREWVHSYREEDPMGGYDPYSSSKGAAELVVSAFRRSYFQSSDSLVRLASGRAGNVIGGGDWALDRIIPDCIRSLRRGGAIPVRNTVATRPWQHVLEPLSGYLLLAERLTADETLAGAFNFGPQLEANRSVRELVDEALRHWPGSWLDHSDPGAPHEASRLNLVIDKAHHQLGWWPRWTFATTVERTVNWYRGVQQGQATGFECCRADLAAYLSPLSA
jgi:CDP-glucose 4,6-dehydratase